MKKAVLTASLVLLTSFNICLAEECAKNAPINSNFKQKACQNVFSFVNIDFSAFSPRLNATDVSLKAINNEKSDGTTPVANKTCVKVEAKEKTPSKNDETSFFRLDLLKIIKIKVN